MKKTLLIISIMIFSISLFGQINFKWEKTDSITKNKNQIYSDTKMFIAKTWTSSQSVIQNDDKEAGNIIVKGLYEISIPSGMSSIHEYYSYTITFRMKDNKYKMNIDDVHVDKVIFVSAGRGSFSCAPLEVFDGGVDNCTQSSWSTGVTKNKAIEAMTSLKSHLQNIFTLYEITIKKPLSNNDTW